MTAEKKVRRSMAGGANPNTKLTVGDVLDIRFWAQQGESHAKLAEEFEVSTTHIADIVRRKVWAHVKDEW